MPGEEVALRATNVSKQFKLPHEKYTSLKSRFINFYRRKRSYEMQQALNDISFEVKKGEFFGIVGRNGSGKSTLLKIIAGIYPPTSGKLEVSGKIVPFIELGVGFNPELTGRENVYLNGALLGFSKNEINAKYKEIVDFSELKPFMDQKLKNYSSGMQVRLAFSIAVRAEADILLIDEVLAVGDAAFQRKCYDYFKSLKKEKKTVIFVSHDMNAVREYCDRAILIEDSKIIESGETDRIASEYQKLFIVPEGQDKSALSNNRWGEYLATTSSVNVKVSKSEIAVTQTITAHKPIDGCVAGFRIKSLDGENVTGSNTVIEKLKLPAMKVRQKCVLEWRFNNILSQGSFYIDVTVHSSDLSAVYDWWEDAAKFSVKKERQLPFYAIDPAFSVEKIK